MATTATTGGGGTQQMFTRGGSSPESLPLTLLYTIFSRKRYPFCILSIYKNGTLFTYRLTAVNALSFKKESITSIERFLSVSLFKAIKFICYPFWSLLQIQMTDFPSL